MARGRTWLLVPVGVGDESVGSAGVTGTGWLNAAFGATEPLRASKPGREFAWEGVDGTSGPQACGGLESSVESPTAVPIPPQASPRAAIECCADENGWRENGGAGEEMW